MAIELPLPREKLSTFVSKMEGTKRDEFVASVKVPLLVQLSEPEPTNKPDAPAPRFGTMSLSKESLISADMGLYVFPLKKQANNAFAMMVTVGRAANNDIVLPYDGISKFHAYFSNLPGGWTLVDAKSTNGTYIEGRRVNPEIKEKLDPDRPVTELSFSLAISCRLYSPQGFYDLISQMGGVLGRRKE
jgi:hypothetical protein